VLIHHELEGAEGLVPDMNSQIDSHKESLRMTFTNLQPRVHRFSDLVGRVIDTDLTELWMKGIKGVLSLLILTILMALTGGVIKTFLDIGLMFNAPVEVGLRQIIVDTLILLAVVEVFKTTVTYFSEGRVKVTFIVDTILVVMLTEIISLWFKEADQVKLLLLGAILLTLGVVRVVAVRCSPASGEGGGGRGPVLGREEF
jgi:uncharacterized membrane protein (DUF373 family)